MAEFKFEELKVYQLSLDIIDEVYDITSEFPKDEIYGLSSQFRRACLSISLNIAEGSGSTDKNFKRYLDIALNSLKECIVCCTVSLRRGFISEEINNRFREAFLVIAKMITNLKKYLTKG